MKTHFFLLLFLVLGTATSLFAQGEENSGDTLRFSLLRQNDYIGFNRKKDKSFYEKVKGLKPGKKSSLSFGGSVRLQSELFDNEQFDAEVPEQDNIWFLNRNMLHAHLKIGKGFEFFGELSSANIFGKPDLVPVDKDELALNQLYLLLKPSSSLQFLLGRQNIRLGSGRLIDVREGPNVRLSFDMAEVIFEKEVLTARGIFAVPVRPEEGVFDNEALNFNEYFSTLYLTFEKEKFGADLYGVYKYEADKTWNAGRGDDSRFSLGTRLFGMLAEGFRFNNEFVFQTGNFSGQPICAWTASVQLTQELEVGSVPFIFGLKSEFISGDSNPEDGQLNTFDALYPRGAYFGRVARFGPSNLFDLHPSADAKLGKLSLSADYMVFWRFSTSDGLYNPALILEYPSLNNERFIGHQIGTISGYEFSPFFFLELETNVIFPGDFLTAGGLDDNLFHAVLTAELKF